MYDIGIPEIKCIKRFARFHVQSFFTNQKPRCFQWGLQCFRPTLRKVFVSTMSVAPHCERFFLNNVYKRTLRSASVLIEYQKNKLSQPTLILILDIIAISIIPHLKISYLNGIADWPPYF